MTERTWLRPLGFLLLMLGAGLRLDSAWQRTAWLILVVGVLVAGTGLASLPRSAFVPPDRQG